MLSFSFWTVQILGGVLFKGFQSYLPLIFYNGCIFREWVPGRMGHVGTVVSFQREGSISISSAFSETEGHYCFKTIILAALGYSRGTKLLKAMK